jgi:hypothetical protein
MSTTYTAQAWAVLVRDGWCSVAEVHHALPSISAKNIEQALRTMGEAGMVICKGTQPRRYGVTLDCLIPRGLSVREVQDIVRPAP